MKPIDTRILAGIQIPATPVIDRAMEYARLKCEPYLFNHVVRSWLFAVRLGQIQNIEHDAEVVAVGTLLHDITLSKNFAGPRRFEVEGADLARSFETDLGFDKRRAQLIWDSVALVAHVQALVPKLAADLGGKGRAAIGVAGSTAGLRQTARFGSRGEDIAPRTAAAVGN